MPSDKHLFLLFRSRRGDSIGKKKVLKRGQTGKRTAFQNSKKREKECCIIVKVYWVQTKHGGFKVAIIFGVNFGLKRWGKSKRKRGGKRQYKENPEKRREWRVEQRGVKIFHKVAKRGEETIFISQERGRKKILAFGVHTRGGSLSKQGKKKGEGRSEKRT